jgi:quercetin dioxygenase-like cupin family protein
VVRGEAVPDLNRIVAPPVADAAAHVRLGNRVYPLRAPLALDGGERFASVPIFKGATPNVAELSCHASVLAPGHSPHDPHTHRHEEVLLLLDGEVDVLLPDADADEQRTRLVAGQWAYYPAGFHHTIRTAGDAPATYVMFKWHHDGDTGATGTPLGFRVVTTPAALDGEGYRRRDLLDGPTGQLRRLHAHASVLDPGAGYDAHADAHDVAIVVLDGELETLGQRVGPHAVLFHPAGELHGLRNPGAGPARYLVLELHGGASAPRPAVATGPAPSLLSKLADPVRWRRLAGRARRRVARALRRS